jgi:hypothetical protein
MGTMTRLFMGFLALPILLAYSTYCLGQSSNPTNFSGVSYLNCCAANGAMAVGLSGTVLQSSDGVAWDICGTGATIDFYEDGVSWVDRKLQMCMAQ